jgi:hypothetical protein
MAEKFAWRSRPSGWLPALLVFGTAFQLCSFIIRRDWTTGLLMLGYTCAAALGVLAWRNQKLPALELRDEEVRYSRWPFGGRRRVPFDEIDAVEVSRWRRAILYLRSGERLVVNLKLIEGISRERAASALERAAAAASRRT